MERTQKHLKSHPFVCPKCHTKHYYLQDGQIINHNCDPNKTKNNTKEENLDRNNSIGSESSEN